MDSKPKGGFMREAIIGSVIVLIILVSGTFWNGRSVSDDTEDAVHEVSLLYLDELASRREQSVATTLEDYIDNMNIALGLIQKENLASIEALQAYQTRMKQLYGLEKFAFVDTNGLIYTANGTRTDIALYNFNYNTISGPEISLKNIESTNKKIIVAMPVDRLAFAGQTLVACFMELDMNKMLTSVSLQSNSNGSTFSNIYTRDGNPLADFVLGGLAREGNLLEAIKLAKLEDGYSVDEIVEDFAVGRKGMAAFSYDNISVTLCYVPIHGTEWMLTALIRDSVISKQISSITEGIVFRSLLQSLLMAIVLTVLFAIAIMQMRKTAKMTLDKEVSETENRVKQQELEEQLALQEELLAQEQKRKQQDSMITALASDYRSVYYVDIDQNECICYRKDYKANEMLAEGAKTSFSELMKNYANEVVTDEYRQEFLNFIDPKNIRQNLEKQKIVAYRYLVHKDGVDTYEMIRMAGVRHPEDRRDHLIHAIGVGFANIDSEMRESLSKNQALSDALRTAEEANRAKTVFLSSMSHEIRSPMNAIIGLDSLALNDPNLSESTKDYLEKIGSSAQHLLSLINDILDMSRIESGRMVIRNEEFAFSKLIEQINTMFGSQCQEKELNYVCRINGNIDEYYIGDSTKIRQMLINILSNSVKFTPRGGNIDFIVEKTADFDGKSTIKFTIRDTGIGMSKDFLPKIFDTFSQEDDTSTNKYGSTGLGMAITKSIVDMMNGKLEVESEKDVGTTFTVILTLMDAKKHAESIDDIEIKPQEMSVLVTDDDPLACEHAKLVLGKAGIMADTALSGKEAIDMIKLRHARREPYNLIIIDWQMPEQDGVEVTRQIRSLIGDESAIIILTAYNWDDIMEEALSAGVDSFIAKPLFMSSLLEEFRRALKKKKASQEVAKPKADLKGRKILLAEDMQVNAEIMMMVLSMREMEAEHAENGKIAVEMFEKSPTNYYAAVLMDIRMPEMDGLEATQTIRALPRPDAKTIPIIALTANAFDEDVQRSLQAGMNAHLTKPVEPEVLFETLETMIPA